MPPFFKEFPPSGGGGLLLALTTVVESRGVYVFFWVGEYVGMLSLPQTLIRTLL